MEGKGINPKVSSGTHKTYWLDTTEPITFEKLQSNEKCDVVIIGGGIAGMTIAYTLVKSGKKVILVEDGNIASGETGRTSAHLTAALDDRYYEIEKLFGEDGARHAADSHTAAINYVEKIVADESIRCEFKRLSGYLFLHPSDEPESIQEEYTAAKKAGLDVQIIDKLPGLKNASGPVLEFRNQARFHPLKYLKGLADVIRNKGGRIYTQTHVKDFDDKGVTTETGFRIDAEHIVVATNTPVNNKFVMHLKQFPLRTYIIGVLIKKNSLPDALWWDTGDYKADSEIPPYHYMRIQNYDDNNDMFILGGEDHPTGLADAQKIKEADRYANLEKWLKDKVDYTEVVYKWSGQVMEPVDCMAFIGRNPLDKNNVYIATGDSGNGLTHGTIAGLLIPDLINGRDNPWEKIYSPSRFKIGSIKTWIKEFGGGFIDYLKNNPKHADEVMLNSIKEGEASIIQFDKEKYGAFRDENGQLHFVSAECTHLKCLVKWNGDEKSWDCPCHGSRFTYNGKVINGPANEDLFYWTDQDIENRKLKIEN